MRSKIVRAGAVKATALTKLRRNPRKIDILATKLAVAVIKRMHGYFCSGSRAGCELIQTRATRPPLQFRAATPEPDKRDEY